MISSQRLAESTERRIEAIQIARDGLEAMTNIRNTNWLLYGADYENCWNVFDYDPNCIGNTTIPSDGSNVDIQHTVSQWIRLRRNANNQFQAVVMSHGLNDNFSNSTYRDNFTVKKDSRGFYTQNPAAVNTLSPTYTREMRIDYLNAANASQWPEASNNPKMKVTAIIQWTDPAKNDTQRLEMSTILTNWKAGN